MVQVAAPIGFKDYGAVKLFSGIIQTVKCFEDNSFVRTALEQDGTGKVLVVDGGGSLLGDMLGELAIKNNWNGIVVYGCIRDSAVIATQQIGVKALATIPLKSNKRNEGQLNVTFKFADVNFTPGHFLYADEDGIIVSAEALSV
jgi:regulator of ribonuclease activity A